MPDWRSHIRPLLSSLRLSPTRENEIIEELAHHLADWWHELMASGASEDEATRLALAGLTDRNLLAQRIRTLRQAQTRVSVTPGAPAGRLLWDLWQDLRYAVRTLKKQPTFVLAAVLMLSLGIGANAVVFSAVDAVLLRDMPVFEPDRLAGVYTASA